MKAPQSQTDRKYINTYKFQDCCFGNDHSNILINLNLKINIIFLTQKIRIISIMKRSKLFKQVSDQTTELYDRVTKIETQILDRFTNLKKNRTKNAYLCEHLVLNPDCQEYDSKIDYYDLFWKTFLLNEVKRNKVEAFTEECQMLNQSIDWIEKKLSKYQRLVSYRNSGLASCYSGSKDGQRFTCKIQGCGKTYESLGALDLHHKIKHEGEGDDSGQSSMFMDKSNNGKGCYSKKKQRR